MRPTLSVKTLNSLDVQIKKNLNIGSFDCEDKVFSQCSLFKSKKFHYTPWRRLGGEEI
jgi:hypothetical protein